MIALISQEMNRKKGTLKAISLTGLLLFLRTFFREINESSKILLFFKRFKVCDRKLGKLVLILNAFFNAFFCVEISHLQGVPERSLRYSDVKMLCTFNTRGHYAKKKIRLTFIDNILSK